MGGWWVAGGQLELGGWRVAGEWWCGWSSGYFGMAYRYRTEPKLRNTGYTYTANHRITYRYRPNRPITTMIMFSISIYSSLTKVGLFGYRQALDPKPVYNAKPWLPKPPDGPRGRYMQRWPSCTPQRPPEDPDLTVGLWIQGSGFVRVWGFRSPLRLLNLEPM